MASRYPIAILPTTSTSRDADADRARSDYFYELLDQLLIIGRRAGGDALIDATLIGDLLTRRKGAA